MCKVLNARRVGKGAGAIASTSAGRASNPFVIGRDGSRDEVIAKCRA